jgi:hypothetical protein
MSFVIMFHPGMIDLVPTGNFLMRSDRLPRRLSSLLLEGNVHSQCKDLNTLIGSFLSIHSFTLITWSDNCDAIFLPMIFVDVAVLWSCILTINSQEVVFQLLWLLLREEHFFVFVET